MTAGSVRARLVGGLVGIGVTLVCPLVGASLSHWSKSNLAPQRQRQIGNRVLRRHWRRDSRRLIGIDEYGVRWALDRSYPNDRLFDCLMICLLRGSGRSQFATNRSARSEVPTQTMYRKMGINDLLPF
jgi:hypothetical protein